MDVALGNMVRDRLGSAGLKLGLNDIRGLFQPKQFHETSSNWNSSDRGEFSLVLNVQLSIKMGGNSAFFL